MEDYQPVSVVRSEKCICQNIIGKRNSWHFGPIKSRMRKMTKLVFLFNYLLQTEGSCLTHRCKIEAGKLSINLVYKSRKGNIFHNIWQIHQISNPLQTIEQAMILWRNLLQVLSNFSEP